MASRRPLATVDEVADYLQKPIATLHQWSYKGLGPKALKVGRTLRYRWDDVDRWLDQQARDHAGVK